MRLLGGVYNNITEGDGEERKGNEEEISKDEIKEAIKKIKEGKATEEWNPGRDMEVWRRGDNGMDVDFLQQSIEGRRMAGRMKRG